MKPFFFTFTPKHKTPAPKQNGGGAIRLRGKNKGHNFQTHDSNFTIDEEGKTTKSTTGKKKVRQRNNNISCYLPNNVWQFSNWAIQYFVSIVKKKKVRCRSSNISLREKKLVAFEGEKKYWVLTGVHLLLRRKANSKKKMGWFLTEQSAVSDGDEFSGESLMIAEKRDALHQF